MAFAATALLVGCATAGREAATVRSFAEASTAGISGAVLFRIEPPDAASPAAIRLARANALDGSGGAGYGAARYPSRVARDQGWQMLPNVPPGTWFLRLEGVGGSRAAAPAEVTFHVPPGPPRVTYIGSFRLACEAAEARPCRVEPVPADDSAAAAAAVAAEGSGLPPPVTALARPYPPRLADAGLAAPTVPDFRVDTRLWLAAIDWAAVTSGGAVPTPPAEEPTSRLDDFDGAEMASTQSMGGQIGGAIGGAMGAAAGAGSIFALGAMVAVIVVVVPIALIARAIAEDQRHRRDAEAARRQAEALRVAALAQEQWGPCTAGIAATLAPENVERHLRATFAPGRETGRRAALPGAWQSTVTRVIFRHCGGAPDLHGVEVATHWTATRPGETAPAFAAAFSRTVAGATPDARLVHPVRPPWEVPTASEAACRPLADYCGGMGSALLLQEVAHGVTEARDAIAATR